MDNENEYAVAFGKRFQMLLDENGLSQTEFSDIVGVSNSALSLYALGKRVPRIDNVIQICEYFDVSLDYMFGLTTCRKAINQMVIEIPIYKTYISGQLFYQESNIDSYLPVAKERFPDANNMFGYKIKSNKMSPRFYSGDIAIIRRTKEIKAGDVVMITIGKEEAIIREIIPTENGWVLNPFNYQEKTIFYSWDDIENLNVRLIGKVIENLVKF